VRCRRRAPRSCARAARPSPRAKCFDRVTLSLWPPVRVSVRPGWRSRAGLNAGGTPTATLDLISTVPAPCPTGEGPPGSTGRALHLPLRPTAARISTASAPHPPAGPPPAPARRRWLDVREFRARRARARGRPARAAPRPALGTRMNLATERRHAHRDRGDRRRGSFAVGGGAADDPASRWPIEWHVRHQGVNDTRSNRLALETLVDFDARSRPVGQDSVGPRAPTQARGANIDLSRSCRGVGGRRQGGERPVATGRCRSTRDSGRCVLARCRS
jgi:hypothetical protein